MNDRTRLCVTAMLFLIIIGVLSISTLAETIEQEGWSAWNQRLRNGHDLTSSSTQAHAQSFNVSCQSTYTINTISHRIEKDATEAGKVVRLSLYTINSTGAGANLTGYIMSEDVLQSTLPTSCTTRTYWDINDTTLNCNTNYVMVLTYDGSNTGIVQGCLNTSGGYANGSATWKPDGQGDFLDIDSGNDDFDFVINYTSGYTNYSIQVNDWFTGNGISGVNITLNGTTYTTNSSGGITTNIYQESNAILNHNFTATGYVPRLQYSHNVSTDLTINLENSTTRYFRIYVNDGDGTLLTTTPTINVNGTELTQNPWTGTLSNYINVTKTTANVTINITDNSYYHQDYSASFILNSTNYNHSINLTWNQLILTFIGGTNTSDNRTNGTIEDSNQTYGFYNSTHVVIQQNLSQGVIKVRFGLKQQNNWTQFYEYVNDYETHLNEELELLDLTSLTREVYISVTDYAGSPIENAVIRLYSATGVLNTWTTKTLFGQILTDVDGLSKFYYDEHQAVYMTVTATGYDSDNLLVTPRDFDIYTYDNPLTIRLREDVTPRGLFNTFNNYGYRNASIDVFGIVAVTNATKVEVTTSYRTTNALPYIDITSSGRNGQYVYTLVSGRDFSAITPADIMLSIRVDDVVRKTVNITYIGAYYEQMFTRTETAGYDQSLLAFAGLLALILVSCICSFIFKKSNAGKAVFFIGTLPLVAIHTGFIMLLFLGVLTYIFKGGLEVVKE